MASETKFVGTGASVAGINTDWANPGRITAENGSSATATFTPVAATDYIQGTNCGFAIPVGAAITGVEVGFKVYDAGAHLPGFVPVITVSAKLVKGGAISGNDGSDSASWGSTALAWFTLGSSTSMWGLALTPSDCNASDFGAVVACGDFIGTVQNVPTMDAMKMTVYYSVPLPSSQGFSIAP